MSGWQLTELAERDLREILDYVELEHGPVRADRILDDFVTAFDRLAAQPRIGHARRDLTDLDVAFWSVHSWLVVHRLERRTLVIVRVLSGRRDVRKLLDD